MNNLKSGQKVLMLWGNAISSEKLKSTVEEATKIIGTTGKVCVENVERLSFGGHPTSTFDVVISGLIQPQSCIHSNETLSELLRVLKPKGSLVIYEPVVPKSMDGSALRTSEKLISALKINGLVSLSEPTVVPLPDDDLKDIQDALKTKEPVRVVKVQCEKPNFEVGSSAVVSFGKANISPAPDVASVWKLDATSDDVETIDSNELLTEADMVKPDAASLKVCGTTGKRKACKNCSCGLADELASEETSKSADSQPKTSSCGNCYLGDAFRCASCPYLGMPAFKPGEKVQLTDALLKMDL